MAATNYTPISLYYSTTSGASGVPNAANLVNGELAINITDGKLFYKDNSGVVQVLATKSGTSGVFSSITNTGLTSGRVVYSTTGGLETDSANLLFNGTTLTANTLNLTNALGTTYGGTGLSSFTSGGVVYASSSSVLATGSALTFDGNANLSTGGSNPTTYNTLNVNNTASNGYSRILFNIGASGANGVGGVKYAPGLFFAIGTDSDSSSTPMTFNLNGSEQMRLTSTGLGIGTSSPATKLHVNTAAAGYGITIAASSQTSITYQLGIDSNSNLAVYDTNAAAQRLVLSSSGNLGLGVTPSATNTSFRAFEVNNFTVFSGTGGLSSYIDNNAFFNTSGQYIYKNSGYAGEYAMLTSDGSHRWYTAPSGTAGNAITFTQAMTLDASGNLGIGTTSPNASAILDAQSTTKGVRMPNMTTTQKNAISSPAAGLMVFDTTLAKLCVYSGSAWQTITSV